MAPTNLVASIVLVYPMILLFLVLPASGGGAKCFKCGYKEIEGQEPTQINADLPLCMDKPSYEVHLSLETN